MSAPIAEPAHQECHTQLAMAWGDEEYLGPPLSEAEIRENMAFIEDLRDLLLRHRRKS